MLRLAASADGNVVLSEGGHRATCDVRKKATAQAIMRPELREGMAFIMTLWGTGVIKVRAFSCMAKAKEWFISGLHFPSGAIRMRTPKTNSVAVSVFSDRLVCTPTDQLQSTFIIPTRSSNSILAFDAESGDVGINVGQLTYQGIPVVDHQRDLFEDHSQYLQMEDSTTGTSIQSRHPNPLAMCHVPDLILSPGDVLTVFVTGPKQIKDTGAYIRLWLQSTDQQNLDSTPENEKGHFIYLSRCSTEQWYIHVEANEILVLNRVGNPVVDSITVTTDVTKMTLAFELYKVSVSVMKSGDVQSNEMSTLLSRPFPSAPNPHHKRTRRHRSRATAMTSNSNVKSKHGSSTGRYLTPKPVVYNPVPNDQARSNPAMSDGDPGNEGGRRIINADQSSLSSHEARQHQLVTNRSSDGIPQTSETGVKATAKHLKFELSTYPVQESNYEDASSTELKTVWENDADSLGTNSYPSLRPIAKIVGYHRSPAAPEAGIQDDPPEARARPHGARSEANGAQHGRAPTSDVAIDDDYVDTDQVACEHNVLPTVSNGHRFSSFETNDSYHKTDVKTI